jgi:glycerophosphoryl diester phosphodiesterase
MWIPRAWAAWLAVCCIVAPAAQGIAYAEDPSPGNEIAFHLAVSNEESREVWTALSEAFPELGACIENLDQVLSEGESTAFHAVRVTTGHRAQTEGILAQARERGLIPEDRMVLCSVTARDAGEEDIQCLVLTREPGLVARNPQHVTAVPDPYSDPFWRLDITFDDATGKAFGDFTEAHLGRSLAIVHAGKLLTAPVIRDRITKNCVISGNFSREEAEAIAQSLGSPAAEPLAPPGGLRAPRHGGVYVVAHRGVHDGIPENTIAAYARAIELGVDFVEVDVRTSADGHLVCVHNATIDAYVQDGATGAVAALPLAELQALDIGSRVAPEWAGERIPTFEQVLALCSGKVGIYLDLKAADGARVLAAVREYGMEQDVLWYAGPRVLRDVAEACPTCFPVPDPGPEALLPRILEQFSPKVVAAVWKHFSPSFVAQCHAAGAIVIVDESDPSCWSDALAWGADGIQTDHVEAFIAFLKAQETTP